MCVIMFCGNYPGGKLIDLVIENKYENHHSYLPVIKLNRELSNQLHVTIA